MLKKMVRKFGKNFYSETYFIGEEFYMARSSRIIIIFVVIALMLGIGCLFLIDFSGGAQNLQNAQKNTVTEVENDAPGNKKVEADRWSVIEGR